MTEKETTGAEKAAYQLAIEALAQVLATSAQMRQGVDIIKMELAVHVLMEHIGVLTELLVEHLSGTTEARIDALLTGRLQTITQCIKDELEKPRLAMPGVGAGAKRYPN